MSRSPGASAASIAELPVGPFLDVILPALNEKSSVAPAIHSAADPAVRELVLVDGGSLDATRDIAAAAGARVLSSQPGRARQMNEGAFTTAGEVLLFLHADTVLPENFATQIRESLQDTRVAWGRFDVRLSGEDSRLRLVEFLMNWRSRLTGISTGDQAIFVRRSVFMEIRGFREMPLMEDVDLSIRLRREGKCAALRSRVVTSSRRWESNGVFRTILLMWALRLGYAIGVSPGRLAAIYARGR